MGTLSPAIYKRICLSVFGILLILTVSRCRKENPGGSVIGGTVENLLNGEPVPRAFIIKEAELLATTDASGRFEIMAPVPGTSLLVFSAMGFKDESFELVAEESRGQEIRIRLMPDDDTGEVYGELQDGSIYRERLDSNPDLQNWTDQELFDGVSGATIQSKTTGMDLPPARLFIGDSLIIETDSYGQFLAEIQQGTYPLKVSLSAYRDTMRIIEIIPGESVFSNFILERE